MRFLNGSHLFAVLRDMNLPYIPILVPEEQRDEFEEKFGSARSVFLSNDNNNLENSHAHMNQVTQV